MFEMASLQEDALREYDELEQIYLEIGNITDFAKTQCMAESAVSYWLFQMSHFIVMLNLSTSIET